MTASRLRLPRHHPWNHEVPCERVKCLFKGPLLQEYRHGGIQRPEPEFPEFLFAEGDLGIPERDHGGDRKGGFCPPYLGGS